MDGGGDSDFDILLFGGIQLLIFLEGETSIGKIFPWWDQKIKKLIFLRHSVFVS